jgi:hypothetical protein
VHNLLKQIQVQTCSQCYRKETYKKGGGSRVADGGKETASKTVLRINRKLNFFTFLYKNVKQTLKRRGSRPTVVQIMGEFN